MYRNIKKLCIYTCNENGKSEVRSGLEEPANSIFFKTEELLLHLGSTCFCWDVRGGYDMTWPCCQHRCVYRQCRDHGNERENGSGSVLMLPFLFCSDRWLLTAVNDRWQWWLMCLDHKIMNIWALTQILLFYVPASMVGTHTVLFMIFWIDDVQGQPTTTNKGTFWWAGEPGQSCWGWPIISQWILACWVLAMTMATIL